MKTVPGIFLISVLSIASILVGCKDRYEGRLLNPDDTKLHSDKKRFKSLNLHTISYLDKRVYGAYILPAEKNQLAYSINIPSIYIYQTQEDWGYGANGNDFYWDRKWKTPKQFKVWWFLEVDAELFKKNNKYDDRTNKETQPGAAWCEAIITINEPPSWDDEEFAFTFYPDGHVEAEIRKFIKDQKLKSKYTFATNHLLPVLKDKPCLHEIPNPFYGLKKPIHQY
jgi:hypothetical protein